MHSNGQVSYNLGNYALEWTLLAFIIPVDLYLIYLAVTSSNFLLILFSTGVTILVLFVSISILEDIQMKRI
jgi:hypothetical protein